MSSPKVSVVMINRNDAPWIPEAVESVIGQTFTDWELIFVDDGSTDDSAEVIARYAARDLRVIPLILAENVGISAARNRGIEKARGEFIALLDSDDRYLPDTLARYLEVFESLRRETPNLCLLATDAWLISEKGERRGRHISTDWWGKSTAKDPPMWTQPSTWIFRKDVPVRFFEPYRMADVPIFLSRMAAYGPIGFHGEPLIEYRMRTKSVTNNRAALNLRIRIASALSAQDGRLDNPYLPEEVPVPSRSQVAAFVHGRNAKALAMNGHRVGAARETFLAMIADPRLTVSKLSRALAQKLRR